jgi:hypothetical protein
VAPSEGEECRVKPQNFEESVVWYSIIGTYGFYLIGALYILAPAMAWILTGYLFWKLYTQDDSTPLEERIRIPLGVWVWIGTMIVMEVALIVAHLDFSLGVDSAIKSSIGWAKGWALLALFPLIGCLNIRPQLLYRAACIVCLQTLLLFPFFYLGYLLHLPSRLYISPLQMIGGPGPEFFSVELYGIDPENGQPRWQLFTPWGPALGFVANIYFFCALQEEKTKWRWLGLIGCVVMCLVSASRMALLTTAGVYAFAWLVTNITRPGVLLTLGPTALFGGILSPKIIETIENFTEAFKSARAGSSRVRTALGRIAVQRWEAEAPIWGHGIVERGPHLVEYMPIGSHHSWFGLLFVKGIVGFSALAIALFYSFIDLSLKAQKNSDAKVGLCMLLVIFTYTFGENLEILAYLYWPGLIMIGIGFKSTALEEILNKEISNDVLALKDSTNAESQTGDASLVGEVI